jgi:hypothetical protein
VRFAAGVLVLFAAVSTLGSQSPNGPPPTGSVCIAKLEPPNDRPTGLGNPAGGGRSFNYAVQFGKLKPVKVSFERDVVVSGLELHQRHMVKVRKDDKMSTSFWMRFEESDRGKLCLFNKQLYDTWVLWPAHESRHICKCSE